MCAIIDANCLHEVFGSGNRPEAGRKFYDWLEKRGKLVIGGKLRKELGHDSRFLQWYRQAINSGLVTDVDDVTVNKKTKELNKNKSCKSNDAHIIALAQISQARLLYSNDCCLQDDFQNSDLIKNPRGKIYTTIIKDKLGTRQKEFGKSHKKLLNNRSLCRI